MQQLTSAALADCLLAHLDARRVSVFAIGGFGGAGKSTLSRQLHEELPGSALVSGDDFLINQQYERCDDWGSVDRHRIVNQLLEPLSLAGVARYQRYDWPTNRLAEWIEVAPARCLILEGVGIVHPTLLPWFTFTVWVDTPIETANERGRLRDKNEYGVDHDEKWETLWGPNDEDYFAKFRPDRLADALVSVG